VDPDGRPHYYADVYGRDGDVLAALEAGPETETRDHDQR
jgi:hypothetical protein